jgi:hypothetical protein
MRLFSSVRDARSWVGQEAAALGGIPVSWVNQPDEAPQQRQVALSDAV